MNDALELICELVKCRSVTPNNDGCIQIVEDYLKSLGFSTNVFECSDPEGWNVNNLYASIGSQGPSIAFVGHVDVVPVGDIVKWESNPFEPTVKGDFLFGRGVADMKGAIGCFCQAVSEYISENDGIKDGSIIFLITGDEEEGSQQGTRSLINWCLKNNKMPNYCLIGEPTCRDFLGQGINVGRRGSINFKVTSNGTQGHVAYPEFANNAIDPLISFLNTLMAKKLDTGSEGPKTTIEITSISVDNEVSNIIPGKAEATFNIRFNNNYTGESLSRMFQDMASLISPNLEVKANVSGEPFVCDSDLLISSIKNAVTDVLEVDPELTTGGATSDGRFLINYCPVVEFGMTYNSIHKENEMIKICDINNLVKVYKRFLYNFFGSFESKE